MVPHGKNPGSLLTSSLKPVLVWVLISGCTANGPSPEQGVHVSRILGDARYEWVTIETANTRIHFPSGSYAHANQAFVRQRAEDSRTEVLRRLGEPGYPNKLELFYVDAREDMGVLTGTPVTGYSYFDESAVVLVLNENWRAFERHELTHVVTLGTWAGPSGIAVVEGLATFVDGECGGYANGRVARTIMDKDGLIPLDILATDFRGQNDLAAYLQAASVVEFMVLRNGAGAIPSLWDQGLQSAPGLLGISAGEFDQEFEDWLSASYEPLPETAWEAIRGSGCGISVVPPSDGGISPAEGVTTLNP